MKKNILVTLLALTANNVFADAIGVTAGAQAWSSTFDGRFGKSAEQTAFELDSKIQGSYFLAFEHPLPFLPNLRIAQTSLDTDGTTVLVNDFEFEETTFTSGSSVATVFDFNYRDYTLYYEVFDNDLVSFDFGLTVRDVDTDISAVATSDNSISARQKASGYLPMLYVATEIGIPTTDWFVFANGNFLSFDNHTLYDYQVGARYQLVDNLAVELSGTLGYRAFNVQLEDLDDLYTDLDFKGIFAGIQVHF
jgi:outer membrane protein